MSLPAPERVSKLLESRRSYLSETRVLRAMRAYGCALIEDVAQVREPPQQSDALVVGAGLSGLSIAAALAAEGRAEVVILEKSSVAGGMWSFHGSSSSRTSVSGPAYQFEAPIAQARAFAMHTYRLDILADVVDAIQTHRLASHIYFRAEVCSIVRCKTSGHLASGLFDGHVRFQVACNLVCVCTGRRLGVPRQVPFRNEDAFAGVISRGLSDDSAGVNCRSKRILIVGMGAHAMELMQTALKMRQAAQQVAFLARRLATALPSALNWLIYLRPWDVDLQTHPSRASTLVLRMARDVYAMCGAEEPRAFRPDSGNALLSDLFFVGHHLGMVETNVGAVHHLQPRGVVAEDGHFLRADAIVKCACFGSAHTAEAVLEKPDALGMGLVDLNLWIKGELHLVANRVKSGLNSSPSLYLLQYLMPHDEAGSVPSCP